IKKSNTEYNITSCTYWNDLSLEWVSNDCITYDYNINYTSCSCNYLSLFSSIRSKIVPQSNTIKSQKFRKLNSKNLIKTKFVWYTLVIIYIIGIISLIINYLYCKNINNTPLIARKEILILKNRSRLLSSDF